MCAFFILLGYWVCRGHSVYRPLIPQAPVHKLLMRFFTEGNSKIELSQTYFFDIMTTHNYHPSYIKHISSSIFVFFT